MAISGNTQDNEHAKFREINSGTPSVGMSLDSGLAGEDLTAGVMKVEQRFSYSYNTAVGTTVIKGSAGFLHGIMLGVTSAGGNIVLYDNASGTSASVIGLIPASAAAGFYTFDVSFANGLVVANVGTQTYTASYR